MKVQCQNCYCIIQIDDIDLGSAMLCGQCEQIVQIPSTYDSPNVLIGEDFIVRRRLGEGGMGAVHLAHQVSLDREVALKVLHPQFTRDRDFVVNFIKEARTAAKLNHPNIVQAYAVGEERAAGGSIYFIAMELIEGESVQDVLRRDGTVPVTRSLEIVRAVSAALDHAWEAGSLIHRDIKPDNIMIRGHDNAVKLADLGLAIAAADVDTDDDEINATPQYLCPENLLGESMDIRGDIYSLGATLFHMLTGEYPFDGDTGIDIARKHINEELRPPCEVNPEIPLPVSDLVAQMMEKDPEDRYSGPKELMSAIDGAVRAMKRPMTGRGKRKKFRGSGGKTSAGLAPVAAARPPKGSTSTSVSRVKRKKSPSASGRTKASPKRTTVMAPEAPAATTAMPANAFAPPPKKKNTMLFVLIGVIAVVAIALIAILAGGGNKPANNPPPPNAGTETSAPAAQQPTGDGAATPPKSGAGTAEPAGVDKEANLNKMIADVKSFAKKNPKNYKAQYDRWMKIRAEAQTIGAREKALEAHSQVSRLRKLK